MIVNKDRDYELYMYLKTVSAVTRQPIIHITGTALQVDGQSCTVVAAIESGIEPGAYSIHTYGPLGYQLDRVTLARSPRPVKLPDDPKVATEYLDTSILPVLHTVHTLTGINLDKYVTRPFTSIRKGNNITILYNDTGLALVSGRLTVYPMSGYGGYDVTCKKLITGIPQSDMDDLTELAHQQRTSANKLILLAIRDLLDKHAQS